VQIAQGPTEHKLDAATNSMTAASQRRAKGNRLQANHHVASGAVEEAVHSDRNALEESISQRDTSIRWEHAACLLRDSTRCSDDNQRLTRPRVGTELPDRIEVQESDRVLPQLLGVRSEVSTAAYERQQAGGDSTAVATTALCERPQDGLLYEVTDVVRLSPAENSWSRCRCTGRSCCQSRSLDCTSQRREHGDSRSHMMVRYTYAKSDATSVALTTTAPPAPAERTDGEAAA
jgi:hypothetical protein